MPLLLRLCGCILLTALVCPQAGADDRPPIYPSAELLEFLAEFGELDEETYELIEYHALRDGESRQPEHKDED